MFTKYHLIFSSLSIFLFRFCYPIIRLLCFSGLNDCNVLPKNVPPPTSSLFLSPFIWLPRESSLKTVCLHHAPASVLQPAAFLGPDTSRSELPSGLVFLLSLLNPISQPPLFPEPLEWTPPWFHVCF